MYEFKKVCKSYVHILLLCHFTYLHKFLTHIREATPAGREVKVKLNVRRRWKWSQVYDHVFKVTFEGDTDACDKGQYIYCRSEKIRQMDSYLVVLFTVDLYKREPLSSVIISVTAGFACWWPERKQKSATPRKLNFLLQSSCTDCSTCRHWE